MRTTGRGRGHVASPCGRCGGALRVTIVEQVAHEHLAGRPAPMPVVRFHRSCGNDLCTEYRRVIGPPQRP